MPTRYTTAAILDDADTRHALSALVRVEDYDDAGRRMVRLSACDYYDGREIVIYADADAWAEFAAHVANLFEAP